MPPAQRGRMQRPWMRASCSLARLVVVASVVRRLRAVCRCARSAPDRSCPDALLRCSLLCCALLRSAGLPSHALGTGEETTHAQENNQNITPRDAGPKAADATCALSPLLGQRRKQTHNAAAVASSRSLRWTCHDRLALYLMRPVAVPFRCRNRALQISSPLFAPASPPPSSLHALPSRRPPLTPTRPHRRSSPPTCAAAPVGAVSSFGPPLLPSLLLASRDE